MSPSQSKKHNKEKAVLTAGAVTGIAGALPFVASAGGGSSTPFLTVHNGKEYIHENDFLFGKPNTAFKTHAAGLAAYTRGIGGDTYLLSKTLKPNEDGELKMQIREIEPEESFIDTFQLNALDLKENEHYVVDGNLEDSYIFNTKETKTIEGQTIHHYHHKQTAFTKADTTKGDITLQHDDELIIKLPKEALRTDVDTFISVSSHFRDWSLGDSVPFSRLERFTIGSVALGRSSMTTMAGIALLASAAVAGIANTDTNMLKKIVGVPYAHADVPVPPDPPVGPGGGGLGGGGDGESGDWHAEPGGSNARSSANPGPSGPSKSLILTAQDGNQQTYLQTLFPRYVQASEEVVRIPKEIIKNLKESFLTIRIKATKKHKVSNAFVFNGTPTTPTLTPLVTKTAVHRNNNTDYASQLDTKNNTFLATAPGDVVDVTVQDTAPTPHTTRRYVLTAHGFYTAMSLKTKLKLGTKWIDRLSDKDRTLLKNLRFTRS